MIAINVAEAGPDAASTSQGGQKRSAAYARSFAASTRATLEIIGLFSVVVFITLATMPDLRGPVAKISQGIWETWSGQIAAESADEADAADSDEPSLGKRVFLNPAESNVATYLARRYRVADEAVRVMVAAAHEAGRDRQIDPLLILSVVAVESSMNPFAQSPVGAKGLMQVMPAIHGGKFLEGDANVEALDPVANIRVGAQILSDVIHRGGSIERGLQLYVGAGNLADDGGYASRVLGELGRLRLAASGGVAAALASGMHADGHGSNEGARSLDTAAPAESPASLVRKPNAA